jgi:MFS family permease
MSPSAFSGNGLAMVNQTHQSHFFTNNTIAVLSYFMSKVLSTIGITGKIGQANVILINNCQQFCWALLGANLVDRIGRRPLLLFSNIGCCLVWLAMTVSTAIYQMSIPTDPALAPDAKYGTDSVAGVVCLVFIFIFGAVYSIGFTPLQALYPVEVLSFEMRAKGMGFSGMAVAAGKTPTTLTTFPERKVLIDKTAGLLNQFAWPVSMDKIGWRTYIIFTIWCGIQSLIIFFWIPETKNRTVSPPPLSFHLAAESETG